MWANCHQPYSNKSISLKLSSVWELLVLVMPWKLWLSILEHKLFVCLL